MSLYDIEFYMPPPLDRWAKMTSFSCMRKSFAEGAWAMLIAHYNQRTSHRLLRDGEVIAECGLQTIHVNNNEQETKTEGALPGRAGRETQPPEEGA